MILPDAIWRDRPGVDRLLEALGAGEGTIRIVGGAVRDGLLGLPVSDIDCATTLLPDEVMRRISEAGFKAVPTGLAHGTVTAVVDGKPIEITTLRRDVATDGRHAQIAFSSDWREDAARRDFTINALSADPVDGVVHDYFEGEADLKAGRVRFIGNALERIAEDHLRILRFFRFHARFGKGAPSQPDVHACAARANDLMALSRERIADELLKLLSLPDPAETVALMIERGIFRPVLPEITAADRLRHLIVREEATGEVPVAVRRLASLLPPDPAIAEGVGARLKLSNQLRRRLSLDVVADPVEDGRALAYRIGAEAAVDRILLGERPTDLVHDVRAWTIPRLPIGGGAIVASGIEPGPEVAELLGRIERQWISEGFPDEGRVLAITAEVVGQHSARKKE